METDEWGKDPSVRAMRLVFAGIEERQDSFLHDLRISRLDSRLRQWRKDALQLFEQSWARGTRKGIRLEEKDLADLYAHCLATVLTRSGIEAPAGALPDNAMAKQLTEEEP